MNLCLKCGAKKHHTEFDADASRATGCASSCKACKAKYNKKRWKRIRKKELVRLKKYRDEHRDELNQYCRDWRKKNPRYALAADLKECYGMTIEEYEQRVDDQKGCCAICRKPPKNQRRLHVDHCHKTGKVRKLLCTRCNTSLGMMQDNVQNLQNAIIYLQEHTT